MSRLKRMKSAFCYYFRRLYYWLTRKKAPWHFRPYTALLVYSASLDHRVKIDISQKFFMVLPDQVKLTSDEALFEEDLDEYFEERPDAVVIVCRPEDVTEVDKLLELMMSMQGYDPEIFIINEHSRPIGIPRKLANLFQIKKELEEELQESVGLVPSRTRCTLPN